MTPDATFFATPAEFRRWLRKHHATKSGYSYEQRKTAELSGAMLAKFRANRRAWAFFESEPAGYRRVVTWWVISAKREETRERRLEKLIADCAKGVRLADLLR